MTDKDEQEEFDVSSEFNFEDAVDVNMEDTYIEIFHRLGGNTLTLKYDGRFEEISVNYVDKDNLEIIHDFEKDYPHLDNRVISSIAAVFIDLKYYGHDFYSGDFQYRLKEWLDCNVFCVHQTTNIEMFKYQIEKETQKLFDKLSEIRMDKCNEPNELQQFTPIRWATPEQIKKHYDHLVRCGHFKSGE